MRCGADSSLESTSCCACVWEQGRHVSTLPPHDAPQQRRNTHRGGLSALESESSLELLRRLVFFCFFFLSLLPFLDFLADFGAFLADFGAFGGLADFLPRRRRLDLASLLSLLPLPLSSLLLLVRRLAFLCLAAFEALALAFARRAARS